MDLGYLNPFPGLIREYERTIMYMKTLEKAKIDRDADIALGHEGVRHG